MTKCKSVFCDGKFHYYMVNGVERKEPCPYRKKNLLLEKLSLLEHVQWSEWIRYMDKRAIHGETTVEFTNGTWNEWLRKASFHYCDLTEEEKESDRKFAREVLALIKKEAQSKKIDVVKEMDRIEHEEFMDEYYPREEAK